MGFKPAEAVLYSFSDSKELISALADFVIKAQDEAFTKSKGKVQEGKETFSIAISGGSLPKQLKSLIGNPKAKWEKWHVWFADERAVKFNDPESNYRLVKDEFLQHVPIPEDNIHAIDEELVTDFEKEPEKLVEIAEGYHEELISHFAEKNSARWPVFDLILLGMGPDGHTASLFPKREGDDPAKSLLEDDSEIYVEHPWVAPVSGSPKPPPYRITLTLPVIKHASRVVFVTTGDAKADALHKVLDESDTAIPSTLVVPVQPGTLHWFVDDAASSKTQYARAPFKL